MQSGSDSSSNCSAGLDVAGILRSPGSILLAICLCLINLSVLAGNCLVIAAILTYEKFKKKGVTNVLITSLALSDLLLATAVLPLSIANQVMLKNWFMGTALCQFWLVVDVLCCTASILNLVVIAFDRFFAIKYPMRYPKLMTAKHARILVAAVWLLAFAISFPPLLQFMPAGGGGQEGGAAATADTRLEPAGNCTDRKYMECTIAGSSTAYIIYSASGSFFLPSLVMLYFYLEIYRTVRRTIRNIRRGEMVLKSAKTSSSSRATSGGGGGEVCSLRVHYGGGGQRPRAMSASGLSVAAAVAAVAATAAASTTASRRSGSITRRASTASATGAARQQQTSPQETTNFLSPNYVPGGSGSGGGSGGASTSGSSTTHQAGAATAAAADERRPSHSILPGLRKRASANQQLKNIYNETKAARMLAIIGLAFTVCWLPFFSVYLAGAFCTNCVHGSVFDVFFWMGYFNSALNPCIYALLSRDFRCAFRQLLCRGRQRRNGSAATGVGGGGGGGGVASQQPGGRTAAGGKCNSKTPPGAGGSGTGGSSSASAATGAAASAVRIFVSSESDHGCGGRLLGEPSLNLKSDC